MELEQEIRNLTKHDRLAIRTILSDVYCSDYVSKMFSGKRRRTDVFVKAVMSYSEGKDKTVNEVKTLIENR